MLKILRNIELAIPKKIKLILLIIAKIRLMAEINLIVGMRLVDNNKIIDNEVDNDKVLERKNHQKTSKSKKTTSFWIFLLIELD